ncbi:hypothetical protein AAY473_032575 [Plecturocebus cupreus]
MQGKGQEPRQQTHCQARASCPMILDIVLRLKEQQPQTTDHPHQQHPGQFLKGTPYAGCPLPHHFFPGTPILHPSPKSEKSLDEAEDSIVTLSLSLLICQMEILSVLCRIFMQGQVVCAMGSPGPGMVVHTCNPSTLGGRGGQITCGQEFETSLANMAKHCFSSK